MSAADEARAEAERRYPETGYNEAGFTMTMREAFVSGAEWQASRDAADVARAERHLERMNREWTKVAAINESLTGQLQAAQAMIAEALSYFEDGAPEGAARLLRRVDTSALTEHDRRVSVQVLRTEAKYLEDHDGSDWHYIEMEDGSTVWAADCVSAHADAIERMQP